MQPYYERGGITIYLADCREVLPCLPVASVDVVLADPPYGITSLAWDVAPTGWLPLLPRVLALAGALWCFGSLRSFIEQASAFAGGWVMAQDVVWEKHNGSNFHADRFRRVHEIVAQFYPADRHWAAIYKAPRMTHDATARIVRAKARPPHLGHIERTPYTSHDGGPRLMRSVLRVRSCHGYAVHPTQKPLGILTPILEYSCPRGGLVLDPFMGSGSTLRAAKDLGMRAIGIDVSEAYCEIAARRLDQEVFDLSA